MVVLSQTSTHQPRLPPPPPPARHSSGVGPRSSEHVSGGPHHAQVSEDSESPHQRTSVSSSEERGCVEMTQRSLPPALFPISHWD